MIGSDAIIRSQDIDDAQLIGKEIKLITEQFPGKPLSSKVMSIRDGNLIIDKSGSGGLVNQLIHRQNIKVRFEYKGEPVEFTSLILPRTSGRIQIPLAPDITPLVRRQFVRFNLEKNIRLTYFDTGNIKSARLNKLKWIETAIANIGGGGVMSEMPNALSHDYYVILNLDFENIQVPDLLIGRVCHSHLGRDKKNLVGIEFIVKETVKEQLPHSLIRNLPPGIFAFDQDTRRELARRLEKTYGKNIE
jgi:hypothetical protein